MKTARQETRQDIELMAFAPIQTNAPDPEAWLVHPFLWFQPELALAPPPASALLLTRRNELPPPTFAPLLPFTNRANPQVLWGRPPGLRGTSTSRPPASDLEPLKPLL